MARASGMADRADGTDPFPWVVTLGCLVVAAALFLHSTMPALAEQHDLRQAEDQLTGELHSVEAESAETRRRAAGLLDDPEAIRIEIDKKGLTPQEAIDLQAQDPDAGDATGSRGAGAADTPETVRPGTRR